MKLADSLLWLRIVLIAFIAFGFMFVIFDYPKPFGTGWESIRSRTISIGYETDIASQIEIDHISTWYDVLQEGRARVHIEFIFENRYDETIDSAVIFILPKNSEFRFATGENAKVTSIDFARVVNVPIHVTPRDVHTINLEFDWNDFALLSRYYQWEFYVVTRVDYTDYRPFYRLTYPNDSSVTIRANQDVSMDPSNYRIVEYHPSDAVDYPTVVVWHFDVWEYDFVINGSYADEWGRAWLEPIRQLAFYLPISGFAGLPVSYLLSKKE